MLVVEDEPLVREFIADLLTTQGYTVLAASNGEEALRVAQEAGKEIDLLLTDVVMPLMGGKELSDRMRDTYPDIRVLYTSGYTDYTVIREGGFEPGTGFLQKPLMPESLLSKMREVLDAPKEEHEEE